VVEHHVIDRHIDAVTGERECVQIGLHDTDIACAQSCKVVTSRAQHRR
jgi:hypothetical protein